ncbi:hypothetical protein PJV90_10125 [Aliarcobacter butzleri]|uniref:hypothetical protein n=1 Tax=Aliarcobacter butzleri TaxID=28197 RepID=UPI00263F1526|nr:hypothetical protein [Aliarcobacter butzleri]MDN5128683.1 hypothetical protein [Aliarcobacter butzleri]
MDPLLNGKEHSMKNLIYINIFDNQEMHNLHKILKSIIYILIIEELKLPKSRFYDDLKKEAQIYFKLLNFRT